MVQRADPEEEDFPGIQTSISRHRPEQVNEKECGDDRADQRLLVLRVRPAGPDTVPVAYQFDFLTRDSLLPGPAAPAGPDLRLPGRPGAPTAVSRPWHWHCGTDSEARAPGRAAAPADLARLGANAGRATRTEPCHGPSPPEPPGEPSGGSGVRIPVSDPSLRHRDITIPDLITKKQKKMG